MSIYFVETTVAEQNELLCRWTERFYMEKKLVQVMVDSMAAAQFIDQLLWTFSQASFIPHMIFSPGAAPPAEPVLITAAEFQVVGFGALVCGRPADLEFMTRFETAVHFILRDDTERLQQSRILWQSARDSGINAVHVPYGRQA
ncbi:MAG TPA: DNA polymerase III subunit chi [Deltaproteobacteria bacterium]|jgi:DNA polymerase-3 subunit chi|nr:DNA polymerase III subunit chi [Deltaproteobacteria bacterium]HIJ76630.1 DNA polymerase III subunit chi [Deltaproteobacteria bacterium]